jgi:hypothetical protein
VSGVGAVNTNRAQDPAGLARPTAALQKRSTEPGETDSAAEVEGERVLPLAPHGRRWSVRIHWGIVFAVVASVVLWLAIKALIGLVF